MEEYHQSSAPGSFLHIIDQGRSLTFKSKESIDDDMMAQKYHFLRVLHTFQDRCNAEGKHLLAKEFMEHELALWREEESRQVSEVKQKYNHNRNKIVAAHEKQHLLFEHSEYMHIQSYFHEYIFSNADDIATATNNAF